jgi:phosphatidylglycerol:prolipoprotein diacylglycerol transferase
MRQVLFPLPWIDLPVFGYGMMLFLAFVVCTWLAGRRGQPAGIPKETIQDLAIWVFLGGLLGARIVHLIDNPEPTFWESVKKLPYIWKGGIVLYGAVLGGLAGYAAAYFLVFRKQGLPTLKLADVVAPSVAVGICLGRIGCFLNGCCYGQVACADCPVWAVHFPSSAMCGPRLVDQGYETAAGFTLDDDFGNTDARVGQVVPHSPAWNAGLRPGDQVLAVDGKENLSKVRDLAEYLRGTSTDPDKTRKRGETFLQFKVRHVNGAEEDLPAFEPKTIGLYPTQLYESVSMFLLFLLLTAYYPFRTRDGQVMALLMTCYGVHRFVNEMLRNDPRPEGFEEYSSLFLFAAGVVFAVWLWRKPAQYKPQWVGATA